MNVSELKIKCYLRIKVLRIFEFSPMRMKLCWSRYHVENVRIKVVDAIYAISYYLLLKLLPFYDSSRNISASYAKESFDRCFVQILPRYWITWLSLWIILLLISETIINRLWILVQISTFESVIKKIVEISS